MSIKIGSVEFDIVEQIEKILNKFRSYKPEVKSFRLNYQSKDAEIKLLLSISQTIKRKIRLGKISSVEVPAYGGYKIHEMFDESFNLVRGAWNYRDGKWILDASKLPASEKYFVIMRGKLPKEAIDQIVKVNAAEVPKRDADSDRYWVHSAIKDMSLFEGIWDELAVDRVNTSVRVGVERYFTTAIPPQIKDLLETRAKLLKAIETGDKSHRSRYEYRYRVLSKQASIKTGEIYELIRELLSGEIFSQFIYIDDPYKIASIEPSSHVYLIPGQVGVVVETDLNFRRPAAEGFLSFKKKEFSSEVEGKFKVFVKKRDKIT